MRKVDNLIVGWLPTSIGALLEDEWRVLANFKFVLITSVDSGIDIAEIMMVKLIAGQFRECEPLGRGLLIPGRRIKEIYDATHIFTGFDEMWCFDEKPDMGKPADLWIVAPLNLDQDDLPPSLARWMAESECRLGLGDGIGLNYATPNEVTARLLEGLAGNLKSRPL
jgi:hypothetical protein